jgi:hypothetical protein
MRSCDSENEDGAVEELARSCTLGWPDTEISDSAVCTLWLTAELSTLPTPHATDNFIFNGLG